MTAEEQAFLDQIAAKVKSELPPSVSKDELTAILDKKFADFKATVEVVKAVDDLDLNVQWLNAVKSKNTSAILDMAKNNPKSFPMGPFKGESKDLTSTGSTNVAYAVPVGFKTAFIRLMNERTWHRQLCQIVPVAESTGSMAVEGVSRAAERVAEKVAATAVTQTVDRVQWSTYELSRKLMVSQKLMRNASPDFMAFLVEMMAIKVAALEFSEFATGAGSNCYEGILTNTTIESTYKTTEVVGAIARTLMSLIYAWTDGYDASPSATLIMPRFVKGKLHAELATRVDGSMDPAILAMKLDNFMGIPIRTHSGFTATASAYPVVVGDLKYYYLFDGYDMGLRYSDDGVGLADTGEGMWVVRKDNDGKCALPEAFQKTTVTIAS